MFDIKAETLGNVSLMVEIPCDDEEQWHMEREYEFPKMPRHVTDNHQDDADELHDVKSVYSLLSFCIHRITFSEVSCMSRTIPISSM